MSGLPIPMTPDRSVQWTYRLVPSQEGLLYASGGERTKAAADAVLHFAALTQDRLAEHEEINHGNFGTVYNFGGMAIKVFNKESVWNLANQGYGRFYLDTSVGLSAVRANVIMHEGLRRAKNSGTFFEHEDSLIGTSAPEMLAAFVSEREGGPEAGEQPYARAVWAMSFEAGVPGNKYHGSLPDPEKLAAFYDRAIALCGATPDDVMYDHDPSRDNEIVRAGSSGQLQEIVKVDTTAGTMFSW